MRHRTCSVDDCVKPVEKRGWCSMHYCRWKKHGDLDTVLGTPPGAARAFLQSVLDGEAPVEPNGCILWPFSRAKRGGYAEVRVGRKTTHAGRVVLEHFAGPKPGDEYSMGHAPHEVCGNTHCIAPAHLSWQTWHEQVESRRRDGTAHYDMDEIMGAVRRVIDGEQQIDVARSIGATATTVCMWMKRYGSECA